MTRGIFRCSCCGGSGADTLHSAVIASVTAVLANSLKLFHDCELLGQLHESQVHSLLDDIEIVAFPMSHLLWKRKSGVQGVYVVMEGEVMVESYTNEAVEPRWMKLKPKEGDQRTRRGKIISGLRKKLRVTRVCTRLVCGRRGWRMTLHRNPLQGVSVSSRSSWLSGSGLGLRELVQGRVSHSSTAVCRTDCKVILVSNVRGDH